MSRPKSSSRKKIQPQPTNTSKSPVYNQQSEDLPMQAELDNLEEIIFESFHIPFVGMNIIEEEKLLHQLDEIRYHLPDALRKAQAIVEREQEIISDAKTYAKNLMNSAQQKAAQILEESQQKAAQILDETGIIQQAQSEADQIRQELQRECEALQQKTIAEVKQTRAQAEQEMRQLRQMTHAECDEIQKEADEYADRVLANIDQQLSEMLKVIRNGRQQVNKYASARNSPEKTITKTSKAS